MNKRKNKLLSLILATSMIFTSFSVAFAENVVTDIPVEESTDSVIPTEDSLQLGASSHVISGDVNDLKATLCWNAKPSHEGATTLYAVRAWTGDPEYDRADSADIITAEGITDLNYVLSVVKNRTYWYQIGYAYDDGINPVEYAYSSKSEMVVPEFESVTLSSPLTVKFNRAAGTFGEKAQSDDWIVASWGTASAFDKYELYRNSTFISDVTGKTTYTNSKVVKGTHTYSIRAYYSRSNVYTTFSASPITVKDHIRSVVKTNITWSAVTKKKNIKVYKSGSGSKYYFKVKKKGTKLTATGGKYPTKIEFWGTPTRVQVNYNGKTGWVKWSEVKMKYSICKSKDYSISTKEDFVNSKNLSSTSKYLIWVNRYTQRVNVFTGSKDNWKLKKVFVCCTGNYYQPSKGGTKYIKGHTSRVTKVHKNGRLYYFRYSTSFGGSGTFHTRCKWSDTNKWRNAIKQHPTTKGCVRLYDDPAKYVYGLPLNTTVLIK